MVDDYAAMCDLLNYMVQMRGFETICANYGCEGLTLAQKEHPDLIITDLLMPNLDGVEMIKRFRQQPNYKSIPIFVLSACQGEVQMKALAAGATKVFSKPYDLNVMLGYVADNCKTGNVQ